jgi:hypothetical protein
MIKSKKTREAGNTMGMEEKIKAHKTLVGRRLLGKDGQRTRIILKWI